MPACFFKATELDGWWIYPPKKCKLFHGPVWKWHTRGLWKVLHIVQLPSSSACLPVSDGSSGSSSQGLNSGAAAAADFSLQIFYISCQHVLEIILKWRCSVGITVCCFLFEFYWTFHQIYVVMEVNVLVGDLYCLYMRINSGLSISQRLLYFYPKHAHCQPDAEQLLSCQLQKWQSGFAQSRHRAGVAHYFWQLITKTMMINMVKSHTSVFFHLVWKYLPLIEL